MPKCNFKLETSWIEEQTGEKRPMVLTDAIQAIECTWVRELDHAENDKPGELNGVRAKDFPALPVDYGYRDSKNFWFHRKSRMRAELLPIRKQSLSSVRYAADRIDDKIKFTDEALELMLNVPRVFLPVALKGCVQWARENNVTLITEEHMKIINDKRSKEKADKK